MAFGTNVGLLGLLYVIQKTFCETKRKTASELKFSDLPLGGKSDPPI